MANLKQLLDALYESTDTSTAEELKRALELIIEVQEMSAGERDCIRAAHEAGPLFDGDVPSKLARDLLVTKRYLAHIVVKGESGYNACTYKGASAYRLLKAGV